jgi:hypothetical protein
LKKLLLTVLLSACASFANAGVVTVWGEALSGFSLSTINNFYNGTPGNTSSIATGQLDTVNLTGVNLLWATQPADSYTTAELNTMASFLAGGGRIAFLGEHGSFAPNQNLRINAALGFLGSTIAINNTILDSGFRSASVGDGQILSHPLTAGVNTYQYAAFAPLTISGTAQALMRGEDPFLGNPSIMMAYQNIGAGSIFLITDQNVWDNSPTWPGGFNNAVMFQNLLNASTNNAVPEPETFALLMAGFGLMGFARRKKQAQV